MEKRSGALMNTVNELFSEDCVFISSQSTKETVIKEVGAKLLQKNLVTNEFVEQVLEREKSYPTGIDLKVLQTDLPNVAVPHTEAVYVKTRMIVPIKLTAPMRFYNMIDPQKSMDVCFLFMILNNQADEQANVLAAIMDFITQTDAAEMKQFFALNDTAKIYDFLTEKFKILKLKNKVR